ncbi:MAG: vitamin B12-dependent ribonucleotide reductase, partial [Candidatus Saccharimonadales bacterium]
IANDIVVANCSEFVFLNETSCNLASFNLLKFHTDNKFNGEAFARGAEAMITAMEILVGYADYPTAAITQNSYDYRPLGLGYTNLGALLMTLGLPYDSKEGRTLAATITALLHATSYRQSAKIASNELIGPFAGYAKNKEPMQKVMQKHAGATSNINSALLEDQTLLDLANNTFQECLELGNKYGYRNAQATLLAPVGTISFMMDSDTTGVEPDLALVKYKKLVGGGLLKMVNGSVLTALQKLGYDQKTRELIQEYINANDTIEGCELLQPEHLPVFDCSFSPANGTRSIDWRGHIKMLGATQPFLSGSISKTINMPKNATVEDIESAYRMGWELGCKAIAVYRDGCKESQPMSTSLTQAVSGNQGLAAAPSGNTRPHLAKRKLPKDRLSKTHKFRIGENEGYLVVGMYENGDPGEIFVIMSKAGSSLQGFTNTIAILISLALQHGVPLENIVDKLSHTTFAPNGFTGEKD